MEEQLLFTRIHDALDVPTPPGAYERLRTQLTKKPERPFRWPALEARWEKKGFKLAAGLAIIAIAAVAAAALAVHRTGNNSSPAGTSMSIAAYQKMVAEDYSALGSQYSSPCDVGVHSGCVADVTRGMPTLQKWINDLSRPGIPARFAVINEEMRRHLIQTLAADRDMITAGQASDEPAMDRAIVVAVYGGAWVSTVVPGISSSTQVDGVRYVNIVTSQKKFFDTCMSSCTLFMSAQAASCTTNGGVPCLQLFDDIGVVYATFSKTIVQYAAPDSLATKDARLQADLAAADSVLRTMRVAVAANDQAGINSGLAQLIRLETRIDQDAAMITG
jgi:hypothetical protein